MRQASRRSWRIGQRQAVEVTHLVYGGTLQAEALVLVSSKMRSSLMIEGELPEEGLAALAGNDLDVMLMLARRLTDQAENTEHSLEAIFARHRANDIEGEEHLVGHDERTATAESVPHEGAFAKVDSTDLQQRSQMSTLVGAAGSVDEGLAGESVSFHELAQLLRRPRPRRKAVPSEQLVLFAEEAE